MWEEAVHKGVIVGSEQRISQDNYSKCDWTL